MARIARLTVWVVMFLFVGIAGSTGKAEAKYFKTPYIMEMAYSDAAPNAYAFVTGAKASRKMVFHGTIGTSVSLTQEGKPTPFGFMKEGIHYIILVDNSGSVHKGQFGEVKKQLAGIRKSLKKQDKLTLYTVGTLQANGQKSNVLRSGNTPVAGSEKSRTAKDIKKIKNIKYYKDSKSRTVLYRSINEVLAAYTDTQPDMRTVVLLVTDGEDDSKGKDNSRESTLRSIKNSMVPVYGIMLKNIKRKPNLKKEKSTYQLLEEKNSRGYNFDKCHWSGSKKKVEEGFDTIRDIIINRTYVVRFTAPNNKKLDGISAITLNEKDGRGSISGRIDYSRFEADQEPPVIQNIKKSKSNAITFELTDNSGSVVGADRITNYVVKTKEDGEDGRVWPVSNVSYNSIDNSVVLTFKDDLLTGNYVLTCTNIWDDTQEENKINKSYEFAFKGLDPKTEKIKILLKSYWWVGLILLVLLFGFIIIGIVKKKTVKEKNIDPSALLKADTRKIRLTITDRAGTIKDVEWNVEGSLFVGRSNICNIYFDDGRLSKQHFVIEATKMVCYIEDLESTNGTFVNGVKLTNRRMLLDGDVITAGREKFVFHTVKNEEVSQEK